MKRTYRVAQGVFLAGKDSGDEMTDAQLDEQGYDVPALLAGGMLEVSSEEAVLCPACSERGAKKPPNFKKQETLADHYRKDHPALAVPDIEEV